jgi:hypothetical protein
VAISQEEIENEILGGLPNERDRLDQAKEQMDFSEARFDMYPTRTKDGRWKSGSTRRTSPIFRRVVQVLTSTLYKARPTRKLRDPLDTEWLTHVYKFNGSSTKWKRADELTLIGGFSAWQYKGNTDPLNPIKILLWDAHEIAFWCDPDDPIVPMAIATFDKFDQMARCRLWTKQEVITFATSKGFSTSWAGRSFKEIGRIKNPYVDVNGEGIIPFSFCHWFVPTQHFTTNGPGQGLKELNEHVNERLDRLGDAIFYNGRPVGIATNIDPAWTPPTEIKPGDFMVLPSNEDVGGNGQPPTLSYLLPALEYVQVDWTDLNFYIDHVLEMNNVPPVLIRMIQSAARSGESIKAEQTPLISWVESRRSQWYEYEEQAAKKCVEVTEAHLRANGVTSDAARLRAILDDWEFTLRWPQLYQLTPGPEKDQADDYRLKRGYVSKVGLMMERYDLSEVEAFEMLQKVAQQNATLAALGIDPRSPAEVSPFAPRGDGLEFDTGPPEEGTEQPGEEGVGASSNGKAE